MTSTSSQSFTSKRKGGAIAKGVVLWLVGVVIITAIFVFIAWNSLFKPHNAHNVTVGDVIAGTQTGTGTEEQDGLDTSEYPGYRLVELASALGLPDGVLPDGAIEMGMNQDQARMYLIDLVNQAVAQGTLTPAEADGVLKAYNEGIVSAPVNITDNEATAAETQGE